ncbi:hypothetical protein [Streptacidiphilus sp. P02-A3a]|uniref:hypothetical protein n=1 Tax=Streptacidiphilus sp. P02-A3a TaxID=2704468 RepID=UPI0015F9F1D2|nr:hypothetical protein [Streptacidiphilus sp. P02-A3a]QMU71782.1 hypothetical protein GXP74_29630 [Streptacidiphilus sp. P02-A3a]
MPSQSGRPVIALGDIGTVRRQSARPREPLPDLSGVDLAALAGAGRPPALAAVAADLLSWWPAPEEAVAEYGDSMALRRLRTGGPGETVD